jgi:hypothetical protein
MPDVILVNVTAPNCCGRERTLSAVVAKFESLTREKDDEEKDEDCQFGEKNTKETNSVQTISSIDFDSGKTYKVFSRLKACLHWQHL